MKPAKVIQYNKPGRGLAFLIVLGRIARFCLFLIKVLVPCLPLVAICMPFFLPKTPHMLVTYTYQGTHSNRVYTSCNYLGVHGWQTVYWSKCPLISFLPNNS